MGRGRHMGGRWGPGERDGGRHGRGHNHGYGGGGRGSFGGGPGGRHFRGGGRFGGGGGGRARDGGGRDSGGRIGPGPQSGGRNLNIGRGVGRGDGGSGGGGGRGRGPPFRGGGRFFDGHGSGPGPRGGGRGFFRGRGRGYRGGGGRDGMGGGGGGRGRGPPPGGNGGGPGLGMDGDNYYQNPNNHHSHRFGFSAGSGPGSGPGSSSGSVHDGVSMSASGGGMGNSNSNVNANAKDDMSVDKSFMGSGPGNNEKRSLPTFESMSQSIDDGNSMGLGGSINMNNSNNNNNNSNNKSNKRMRSYESLGSPGNNMNIGMGMGPADDIGMGPSMPPTNIHMNSGPGGRGSPRRDFMHSGPGPGGNSFGRGRGRGRGGGGGRGGLHHSSYPPDRDRDRDRDLPHRDRNMSMNNDMHGGMGPGPGPGPGAIMDSMGGGNDFDEDQFGRKIPQSNAGGMGRGAPYGRGGHRERSFSSMGRGRGGYGRLGGVEGRGSGSGGRYSSMAHSDRFVSGRSGMGMGRGFSHNRPSPAEHYSPRASTGPTSSGGMSPDFHSRHSSGLGSNDINKDSQTQIQTQQNKSHPQDTSINSKSTRQALATSKTVSTSTPSKRDSTPPPQREDEKVDIVPPSPPASQPSGLAQALARLSDANAEMEFQYAKHLQLTKEHEIIKAKIERLKELPVGVDAFKDDLDALMKKDENKYFAKA